jgi:hypothetical protein
LNQEDINNLNRSVTSNEIEIIIKNLPRKSPRADGLIFRTYNELKKLNKIPNNSINTWAYVN